MLYVAKKYKCLPIENTDKQLSVYQHSKTYKDRPVAIEHKISTGRTGLLYTRSKFKI
jgi:hypothetical protein